MKKYCCLILIILGLVSITEGCYYTCPDCLFYDDPDFCTYCQSSWNRYASSNNDFWFWTFYTCSCNSGYYDNGNSVCPQCNYKCSTCSSSATNCDTCSANRVSAPACSCIAKYYDNGYSPSCQACHYSCNSCTSASGCTSCNSGLLRQFRSTSAYCLCPDRYYDPGIQTCYSCHQTCFRCNGGASTNCQACNSQSFRILSSTTCVCSTGYYATSATVQLCSACLYSCLTCSSTSTNCLTCSSALNRAISGNTCPCKSGYFQNSTLLCQACHSSCATCSNSTSCNTCISSQLTTINSSSLCSCTSSQFWTGSLCSACNYKCLTCLGSATNCTSCTANIYRVFSTGSCNCITGYFDNSVLVCVACSYRCLTCSASSACLTCDPSQHRYLSSGQCLCSNGFYDDGSSPMCLSCSYKCLTCNSPTSCLTCNSTLSRVYSSSTGFCECDSTYFQANQLCYPCISTCLTCNNNATCLTCNSGLFRALNTITMLCDCMSGYYLSGSNTCLVCGILCTTCTSGSTCSACKPNLNRFLNGTTCDCSPGYILITSSNTCQTCQYSCLTCTTNYINRCATCNTTSLRSINNTSFQCQCNIGYYDDGSNILCKPCSYTCSTCSSSSTSCTACPSSSNRIYDSISKTCPCAQHYFDTIVNYIENATCKPCLYHCSSCTSMSSCSTCNSSLFRVFDSMNMYCICQGHYYDDGSNQLCKSCKYQCDSCTTSTDCLTCSNTDHRTSPGLSCPCLDRFYDAGNQSSICLACHYTCSSCTNKNVCLTCQASYSRIANASSGLCSCKDRYFDYGIQTCGTCSYSCLTCLTSATQCTSCNLTSTNRYFNPTSKTCLCKLGFFDNAVQVCVACQYSCYTCATIRSCLTCNITYFRQLNSKTGFCTCITGYYDDNSTQICLACQSTCLTCINSTNCTSCNINRNRVLNHTKNYANSTNYFCPCLYKYYSLAANGSCNPCHYSCSQCSSSTINTCLFCHPSSHRTLKISGPTSKCICDDGYFDTNVTQLCPLCHISCVKCYDGFATTCFQCNSTTFMMVGKNTCYQNCPTYYFNNITDMICTLCSTHCLQCVDSTICTKCQTPTFLFNQTCLPKCPNKYYDNETTHSCQPCKVGCINCTTSYNCFECVNSSYYVDQLTTLCQACSSSCLTCFGPDLNQCKNCTIPLYLNSNHMCVNLTCPFGKYPDTYKGCTNCSSLFIHSISCNITQAFLCQKTYQLKNGICVSCGSITGYAIDSTGTCNQICGDGKLIYYQCDDGNNLNGDGCSANCIIQEGWSCSNHSGRSDCRLKNGASMELKKWVKYSGQNKLRIVLVISLPLRLDGNNLAVAVVGLLAGDYRTSLQQNSNSLNEINIDIFYAKNIEGRQLSLTLLQARRLQQTHPYDFSPRLLPTVSLSTSLIVNTFPPANFIQQSSIQFYQSAKTAIITLSILLTILSFIIIPKQFALHSLTFSWIVPFYYFTYFYSTSYTNQWISTIIAALKRVSFSGGFSLGSCCSTDNIIGTTNELMQNIGVILIVLTLSWVVFLLIKLVTMVSDSQLVIKIYRFCKYYLLTVHLSVFMQLLFYSLITLSQYQLNNQIDSINVTIALFIAFSLIFMLASICFITNISKFQGSSGQMSSKAVTRHTIQKEQSSNTQQNNANIVINLTEVKELSKYDNPDFNISSTFFISRNTQPNNSKGFNQTQTQQQQMGEGQSFFPFDYCYLYNNSYTKSKYFLPILMLKLMLVAIFNVSFAGIPLGVMMANSLIGIIFLIYLIKMRPFQSKFTNIRLIVIQALVLLGNLIFTCYLYFATISTYYQKLQLTILIIIMITLATAIIFSFVEHYKIWIHKLWHLCDNCCLSFKLRGVTTKVYDREEQAQHQVIKVQNVTQQEIGEVDAFYARMLQKQAINKQYKKQRMQTDTKFQKDFI